MQETEIYMKRSEYIVDLVILIYYTNYIYVSVHL